MRLLLVCQSESEGDGLSEAGKRQAEAIAGQIAQVLGQTSAPETMWCSPDKAAQQTGEIVARGLNVAAPVQDELGGPREGGEGEDLLEAVQEAQERAWGFLSPQLSMESNAAVAVVCDATMIAALVCQLMGMPISDYGRMRIDPGSLSVINFGPRRTLLASLNEVCHLESLPVP